MTQTKIKICIRIDIDTIRDTQVLPNILEILDTFDIPATFFVTTGPDTTFKNYKNYLNPIKLLKNNAIKQHGIKQMFRGLIHKQEVQKSKNVKIILKKNHELGLHGYHHYNWINTLQHKNRDEITEWISNGCELFENEYGFKPKSFASPGFATSPQFLEALDDFNFEYSSDFHGTDAFYPTINSRKLSTLQLPVAQRSFGELEFEGFSEDEIYNRFKSDLDNAHDFFIFYMHPSYEPTIKKHLLIKVLEYITSNNNFEFVTLSDLAKNIKRRNPVENPANI